MSKAQGGGGVDMSHRVIKLVAPLSFFLLGNQCEKT